jgi:uncharacterized protein YdiU (UPF0061 family)
VVIDRDGVRYDIQLRDTGPTPFSRGETTVRNSANVSLGPSRLRNLLLSEQWESALTVTIRRAEMG